MSSVFMVYSISEVHFFFPPSSMPVGLNFVFVFFVFFLRSLYVYFVLAMQVYIVNTQKWLILYTFAQKMVNIVQICKCVQNLSIFCLQYKFIL